jgi:hypothetical protein
MLVPVLCCCSWRGTLPTRAACPACGVSDHDRVTRERLQKLREILDRPDAWIAPVMRRRLIEMRLITGYGSRPRFRPLSTEGLELIHQRVHRSGQFLSSWLLTE